MITELEGKSLDKFERIAVNATFHRLIMGNPITGAFELFAPDQLLEGPSLTSQGARLRERGGAFYGVVGIVDGTVRFALEAPVDKHIIDTLSEAFAAEFEVHADASAREQVERVVFAGWLNRLTQDTAT